MAFPTLLRRLPFNENPTDVAGVQATALIGLTTDEHLASEETQYNCRHCGVGVSQLAGIYQFFQEISCDSCVEAREEQIRLEKAQRFWINECPEDYRDTNIHHEEFNIEAYKRMKSYDFSQSIMLLGETGVCKTRMACHWAKMALVSGMSVKLMFPDDIKDQPRFMSRREHLVNLCSPDLLVLDDLLLAGCSKESVADFVKDLIDRRLRSKKPMIVTSQVNASDFEKDAGKFGNMSQTERKRIEAIVRRIREKFVTIDCDSFLPDADKEARMF